MGSRTRFIEAVGDQFGFSKQDAERIYAVYVAEKVLLIDRHNGTYTLVHGAFWNRGVMDNALNA